MCLGPEWTIALIASGILSVRSTATRSKIALGTIVGLFWDV